MKRIHLLIPSLIVLVFAACQAPKEPAPPAPKAPDAPVATDPDKDPCDNPQTVAELKACAEKWGKIVAHWPISGEVANGGCFTAWNPEDTVLNIVYADSVTLYRVQKKANPKGATYGHWFTDENALQEGFTVDQVQQLWALNDCVNFDWSTCTCSGGKVEADSIIRFQVEAKIAPNQVMRFGIVGKNQFGPGGPLQWQLLDRPKNPYRLVSQEAYEQKEAEKSETAE